MDDSILNEIQDSWEQKFYSKEEWPSYKRYLLKMPDRISTLSSHYFLTLCQNILKMNLDQNYDFCQAVDFFNSLLLLRKTDCIIKSLKSLTDSQVRQKIISHLNPISVFMLALFKNTSFAEFSEFLEALPLESENFLCFHLPFKVHSIEEVNKLTNILQKYLLDIKSLEVVVKAWSDKMFLINSLWHNRPLTVFIHRLMRKDLPSSITTVLYQGIHQRLSSNNKEISLSGLLIASRVAELLESSEIIRFTLEDYFSGKEVSDNSDNEEPEEQVPNKVFYLEEILNGLSSSDRSRFHQSINSAPSLILQNLSDLDVHLDSLAQVLLRLENKFAVSMFEDLRYLSLVNLTFIRPVAMIEILTNKLKSNSTVGEVILVMDIIREASKRLANFEEEIKKSEEITESKYKVIKERLKKKTKRFFTIKKKDQILKNNLFLQHFSLFCGKILERVNEKIGFMGLSKIFYTLGELVESTGGSCDIAVVQQCVYIIKYVIKIYVSHEKREVSEAAIYLLINIAYKLDGSPLLSEFDSVLNDLQEIAIKLEKVSPELEELATKASLLIAYHN